jgi:hypothetical protein
MEIMNLKSIEKKIWLSSFQDGIWDIYWGILLLGFGVSPVLEEFGVIRPLNFIIFPFLAFLTLFLGKKFISIPRMGLIKFGKKRKSDHMKLLIIGIITFISALIIFILVKQSYLGSSWKGSMSGVMGPIVSAIFFIISISLIAYFMEYKRLYLYAFFFGISIPLAEALFYVVGEPVDSLIAFSVTSIPILITGFVIFFKFIYTYKPLSKEVNDA